MTKLTTLVGLRATCFMNSFHGGLVNVR